MKVIRISELEDVLEKDLFDLISTLAEEESDMVKSPSHYRLEGLDPYESIDVIKAVLGQEGFIHFCQGNALKYLIRAGKKGDYYEDIKKARVYLDWIIEDE